MKASRLMSILLLLQVRERMTAEALAAEFEVSVRTIHRDIDDLSSAGVPVYAERGRLGGFRLLDGYRTRLNGLTGSEAEALLLAGLPGPAAELGLGDAMANAQLKLLSALPGERRDGAERVAARFHLDPVGWYRPSERADILPALADAVWNVRRIRIRYESWKGVVDRDADPLGLVLKAGTWYVVAAVGGAYRTYRVAAIQSFELSGECFLRPDGFDLAAFWTEWVRDFEARLYRGTATVRLSPDGLRRLRGPAPAVASAAERTARPSGGAGWIEADIPIESVAQAVHDLLALGTEAEVLAPPELRERMSAAVARLRAVYAG